MGLYKKEQYFVIVAAVLFLVGAVFMLVNVFGSQEWALWVGLGFAVASALLYIAIQIQHLQFNKKYTAKESEIKAAAVKEVKEVKQEPKAALEVKQEVKVEAKQETKAKPTAAKPSATKPATAKSTTAKTTTAKQTTSKRQ